jgi:CheY-like chemotaxis protein
VNRVPEVLAVVNYTAYGVLLEHALSGLNVSLRLSSTATEARQYLREHSPGEASDVVLLDFTHLRDSGLELLRWIRSERELRSTQVVVLSGRDDASDINRAYEWGIEGYVGKAARLPELAMTVSGVLTAPLKK